MFETIEPTEDNPLARRLQLAQEALVEDEGLTGDLLDAEAQVLLAWAGAWTERWVADTAAMDDMEAYAHLFEQLRALRLQLRRAAQTSAAASDPLTMLHTLLAELDADMTASVDAEEDSDEP